MKKWLDKVGSGSPLEFYLHGLVSLSIIWIMNDAILMEINKIIKLNKIET